VDCWFKFSPAIFIAETST